MRSYLQALIRSIVLMAIAPLALGATISVDTFNDELNDDGDCSLREAVRSANNNIAVDDCTAGETGSDTIELPAGRYTLSVTGTENDDASANDLDVTESVEFVATGSGSVTIEPLDAAAFSDRAFTLGPSVNAAVDVAMRGFTIRGFREGGSGGAVRAGRDLELVDMTFRDNAATAGGSGGAVSFNDPNGTLLIDRSGFVDNYSVFGHGGAVIIRSNSSATVRDSTFVRNHAQENGGAIHIGRDPAILRNVTLADNSANGSGGGFFVGDDGEVLLRNAIVDANRAIGSGPDCAFAPGGGIIGSSADGSTGFNLISDASGCGGLESFPDTIAGESARLAMVGRYDGVTPFRPLLADSPAIDAGSCGTGGSNPVNIGTDQRQVSRITAGSTCDIGAAERNWTPHEVNSTADVGDADVSDGVCDDGTGACTLRAAIDQANETIGIDEVVLPAGTFNLSLATAGEDMNADGDLDVLDSLVIAGEGADATVIDATGIDRAVDLPNTGGPLRTLGIMDLTLRNGDSGGASGASTNEPGGGLRVSGSTNAPNEVRIRGVRMTANRAAGTSSDGGALAVAFADARVVNSTFDANEADRSGSGIVFTGGASGHLERVTVSGNAAGSSAAVGSYGGAEVRIEHSSIVDNTALVDYQFDGNSEISVHASIVGGRPGSNCDTGNVAIVDLGNNLEDGSDCGLGTQSANVDLAPLADVGGPVPLREPNAGSDAVDAAGTGACAASNGRLLARAPFGGTQPQDADAVGGTTGDGNYDCDIGAAERQQVRLVQGPATPADRTVAAGSSDVVMAQFNVTNESGEALDGASARLRLRALGSGVDDADITAVRLYFDANNDGALDAGDEQRGSTQTFGNDDGRITFDFGNSPGGAPGDLLSGSSANYIVVYDFAATLADSGSVQLDQDAALVGLAGGSGAFVFLVGVLGRAALRRPAVLVALSVAVIVLTLTACGGGGGSGGSNGEQASGENDETDESDGGSDDGTDATDDSGGGSEDGTDGTGDSEDGSDDGSDETGDSEGGNDGVSATYALALDGGRVNGVASGRTIEFRNSPLEGATVTVDE